MIPNASDEAPSPPPEPNPYEAPRTRTGPSPGTGTGRSIARGLGTCAGVLAIFVSSLVAFVVTCVPVGMSSRRIEVGLTAGLMAAGLVGVGVSVLFFRGKR